MIDILLRNGDLVADRYGDISLCESENEDVVQTANNNILLRRGGHKFHKELGNNAYNNRIKANETGIEIVQAECENAILNDPRIREVKQVDVTLLDNAICMVDYVAVYAKTVEEPYEDEDNEEDDVVVEDNSNDKDEDTDMDEDEDMDAVDMLEVQEEIEEILIETTGRQYINAFNIGGDI